MFDSLDTLVTAAFGGVSGLIAGVIPDVKKYFMRKQEMKIARLEHELEMERLEFDRATDKLEHAQQYDRESWSQVRESDAAYADQISRLNEAQAEMVKGASSWVVTWNSALRPAYISMIIIIFCLAIVLELTAIIFAVDWATEGAVATALALFWGNAMINGSITGVSPFLLGYRSSRKLPKS